MIEKCAEKYYFQCFEAVLWFNRGVWGFLRKYRSSSRMGNIHTCGPNETLIISGWLPPMYILQPVYDCCEIVRLSKDCLLSWAVLGAVRTNFCGWEEAGFFSYYRKKPDFSYFHLNMGNIHTSGPNEAIYISGQQYCKPSLPAHQHFKHDPLNSDLNIQRRCLEFLNNIFHFAQSSFNGVCHFQTIWQSKLSQLGI